jgi:hypothetical protein
MLQHIRITRGRQNDFAWVWFEGREIALDPICGITKLHQNTKSAGVSTLALLDSLVEAGES